MMAPGGEASSSVELQILKLFVLGPESPRGPGRQGHVVLWLALLQLFYFQTQEIQRVLTPLEG